MDEFRLWDKHDAAVAESHLRQAIELDPELGARMLSFLFTSVAHGALAWVMCWQQLDAAVTFRRQARAINYAFATGRPAEGREMYNVRRARNSAWRRKLVWRLPMSLRLIPD